MTAECVTAIVITIKKFIESIILCLFQIILSCYFVLITSSNHCFLKTFIFYRINISFDYEKHYLTRNYEVTIKGRILSQIRQRIYDKQKWQKIENKSRLNFRITSLCFDRYFVHMNLFSKLRGRSYSMFMAEGMVLTWLLLLICEYENSRHFIHLRQSGCFVGFLYNWNQFQSHNAQIAWKTAIFLLLMLLQLCYFRFFLTIDF